MIRVAYLLIVVSYYSCIVSDVLAIERSSTKCGNACHPLHPEKINVHLVAHTHDDVGWLKSADQYFYGSNKENAPFGVQYILDSVVSELAKNADRRFIYVETAFFATWWEDLPESDRAMVRQLVQEGRLEFVHGGWCMSDEAAPHYTAMIDQMTFGLKFLNETFGECGRPTVAWQIDPFGHSSEVALEFAEMGFDGLFVGRIDFEDFEARMETRNLETIWRPDPSLGEAGDLFTSVLYNLYMPPDGFCFDTYCSDEPIMDNKKLHGYNLDKKIKLFEMYMNRYRKAYRTRNVLVTMGGDFTYTSASSWFRNMDKLIKYINADAESSLHLLYSTPSCYLKALNEETHLKWPVKESDDFFPYGSDEHSYWTGYYTSRPTFKYFVSLANNILQATKQRAVPLWTKMTEEEFEFKKAVAIAQHHDGVTGTEKQEVTSDYSVYLQEGINYAQKIFTKIFKLAYGDEYTSTKHDFGLLRNISQFELTEVGGNFIIDIYNPLSQVKTVPVRFPVVDDLKYEIYDRHGFGIDSMLQSDLIPLAPNIDRVPGRVSNATHDLVFMAENVPALGNVNWYVKVSKSAPTKSSVKASTDQETPVVVLDNGRVQLRFNKTTGLLISLTKADGVSTPFYQNFYWYMPMKEDTGRPDKRPFTTPPDLRASGAYIFRPVNKDAIMLFANASITKYEGKNVFEVHQTFSDWLSQVVRLYTDSDDIEFEWLAGPLPVNKTMGMELVTRYTTNLASNSTFFTDSNGRRWVKRIRNHRKYWNTSSSYFEPVASNYYPLTTAICIRDSAKQLTVITDRPQGGTSLRDGQLEIMLHRRLLYDDDKGVSEPLNEKAFGVGLVARGTHVVQINDIATAADAHRFKAIESAFHPVVMFAKTMLDHEKWVNAYTKNMSYGIRLPPNIRVLTLERLRENEVLFRLEHIFEPNETSVYTKPETIELQSLFSPFLVRGFRELTLAGNLLREKLERMKWNYSGQHRRNDLHEMDPPPYNMTITLQPMQIRTFLLYFVDQGRNSINFQLLKRT